MQNDTDEIKKLQQEVEFYKRQLNEVTSSVIGLDYKIIEMSHEIRQMQRGFALIAGLNQFKPLAVFEEIYDHFAEEINVQMQMDISMVLQPVEDMPGYFSPGFIKGNAGLDISLIAQKKILLDPSFVQGKKSLLVNSQTIPNSFIKSLIEHVGLQYFIITPVVVQNNLIAYLFTGRKIEIVLLAASRILLHDVHALEAIAGVIAALKNQQDQFLLLQKERTRISGEMHDDIGAEVTKIKMFSQALTLQMKEGTLEKIKLQSISDASSKMLQSINEIIWTMNSRNDTLTTLAAYIRRYASEYLELNGLTCIFDFPDEVPPVYISNNCRRNIFLIIKESLHNIVKHAAANKAIIQLIYEKQLLSISIADDGTGVQISKTQGNGLMNMKLRMKDCGGEFSIHSGGSGTTILLKMLLHHENTVPFAITENTT